jgi:hypothetical protein
MRTFNLYLGICVMDPSGVELCTPMWLSSSWSFDDWRWWFVVCCCLQYVHFVNILVGARAPQQILVVCARLPLRFGPSLLSRGRTVLQPVRRCCMRQIPFPASVPAPALHQVHPHYIFRLLLHPDRLPLPATTAVTTRDTKPENKAKQNSAVKTKWLLIVFWGPPNNIKTVSFNFVCS